MSPPRYKSKLFWPAILMAAATSLWIPAEIFGRGGMGGGGRAGGGGGGARMGGGGGGGARMAGGGGGARPAMNRTPSMSRPSPRPSGPSMAGRGGGGMPGGGARMAGGGAGRPGGGPGPGGGNRMSGGPAGAMGGGQRIGAGGAGQRVAGGGQRIAGGGDRLGGGGAGQRIGGGGQNFAGGGNRPGGAGGLPSSGDLNRFLDIPSGGGRPGGAGAAMAGGALAGGAAAAFLHDRPGGEFGGGRGPEIAQLPAGGAGIRGGDMVRPGGGGEGVRRGGDGDRGVRPGGGGEGIRRGGDGGRGDGGRGDRGIRPGEGGRGEQFPRGDGDRGLRPGQGGRGEQIRPGDGNFRPGGNNNFINNRPIQINNKNEWNQWRQNNGNFVRDNWRQNWHDHDGWFNNDWWDHHHHDHWPFNGNTNWWAWAAWPAVTNWFPWGWTQPVYYNYGENVYYQDDVVYSDGQPVASAYDYANQAQQIAESIPVDVTPAPSDWLPLGVFALTQDGQASGVEPTMYLQMTVSKQGIVAGTYQNTATGQVQSIEGMVDKDSQRAAWTAVGKTRPLMETGISNLTQDTAPALIHFADGTTQQWLMVRLDKPAPPTQ